MTIAARLESALIARADRTNPMLIRRVRQELRSKAFIGAYLAMLMIAAIAAVVAAWASTGGSGTTGRGMFAAVASAWTALMCIQASATQRAISADRSAASWDLLELTGIAPVQVVSGVVLSNLVLGLLGAAGLAPFLVLAYLLRGVDLPTIAFALVVLPMIGAALGALAALGGCMGGTRHTRAGMGGLVGLVMLGVWGTLTGMWVASDETVSRFMAQLLRGDETAVIAAMAAVNAWLAVLALCFACASALLTHRALDRSTGPRLAWFGIWANAALWLAGLVAWAAWSRGWNAIAGSIDEVMAVASTTGVLWALLMGLFAVSEDAEITPRQARPVAGDGAVMRRARALLGPGAARGARATLVMAAASVATCLPWLPATPALFVAAYGLTVLMAGDILARRVLGSWCQTPAARRVCTVAVLAVVGLVPAFAAMFSDHEAQRWLLALSPFIGPVELFSHGSGPMDSLRGWVVLAVGAVSAAWMLHRSLQRPAGVARTTARDDDRNPRG